MSPASRMSYSSDALPRSRSSCGRPAATTCSWLARADVIVGGLRACVSSSPLPSRSPLDRSSSRWSPSRVCALGCGPTCVTLGAIQLPEAGLKLEAPRADESLIIRANLSYPPSPVSAAPSELDSRHHGSLPPRFHPDREPGPAQARHGASPAPNPRAKSPR